MQGDCGRRAAVCPKHGLSPRKRICGEEKGQSIALHENDRLEAGGMVRHGAF